LLPFLPSAANLQHDTHVFETVTVHYPWHPLFGQNLRVLSHARISAENEIVCQKADGTRVVLPLWMLNPKCSGFVLGQPFIAMEALVELRHLLTTVESAASRSKAGMENEDDEATTQTRFSTAKPHTRRSAPGGTAECPTNTTRGRAR
jgi:hypothetical protein